MIPDGYLGAPDIAKVLGVERGYIARLCRQGRVLGAKRIVVTSRHGIEWAIPLSGVTGLPIIDRRAGPGRPPKPKPKPKAKRKKRGWPKGKPRGKRVVPV